MMKKKGRPVKSQIRENILEILQVGGPLHGYEIFNIYCEIFGKVHIRSIYYHLKKGTTIGEMKVDKIVQEIGEYSWGNKAEKTYYTVGEYVKSTVNPNVKKYFEAKK